MNENITQEDFIEEKNPEPAYFAITPAEVRYCKDLEPNAKLLYGEITALCNKRGYCWASNKYFADLYDVIPRTVQLWIESLVRNKFIYIELDNTGFGTKRRIFLTENSQKMFAERKNLQGGVQKFTGGGVKNYTHSNTSNNTIKKDTLSISHKSSIRKLPKEAFECVSFFVQLIQERDPSFKLDKSEHLQWAEELRGMHDTDGRSWEEINELMVFSQNHDWWPSRSNTPQKLRKHATTILTQMKATPIKDNAESKEKARQALMDKNSDTTRRLVKGIPQKYYQILSDFIKIDFPGSHFSIDFDDPHFENKIYMTTSTIKKELGC